jgi:hypothetical protein
VCTSEDESALKRLGLVCGLVYDPRELLGVTSTRPRVAGVLQPCSCRFSLSETVHLGNFEFIADYFDGLSLSPRRGDSGIAFMGPTHTGASFPRQAMIEDSSEEFLMTSSRDGGFGLPCPRRRGMGASLTQVTTTSWIENAPIARAMMMVPLWMVAPHLEAHLPFE